MTSLGDKLNFGLNARQLKKFTNPGYEPTDLDDNELIALNQTQVLEDRLNRLNSNIDSLEDFISSLKAYEERSSSVETIFTLSILTSTFVQATNFSISIHQGLVLLGLFGTWALALGGKSLFNTSKRTFYGYKSDLTSIMSAIGMTSEDYIRIVYFILGVILGVLAVASGYALGILVFTLI